MTSRATQNWPDEVTYELSIPDSGTDGVVLDSDYSVRTVVESAEQTVSELIELVDSVLQ